MTGFFTAHRHFVPCMQLILVVMVIKSASTTISLRRARHPGPRGPTTPYQSAIYNSTRRAVSVGDDVSIRRLQTWKTPDSAILNRTAVKIAPINIGILVSVITDDKIVRMIASSSCTVSSVYRYTPYSVCGMCLLAGVSQIAISFIEDRKKPR